MGDARKRYITVEMSRDSKLAQVAAENPTWALLWPWFVAALDDWGRMRAEPMEVILSVFPAFRFSPEDIQAAMECYHRHGLALLYQVDGRQYLQVNPETFYKYQTHIPQSKRIEDNSQYPAPPDHPWGRYWKRDGLSEPESEAGVAIKRSSQHDYPALFEAFWSEYPRKVNKRGALAKWQATLRKKDGPTPQQLIECARNYRAYCEAEGREERYILHATTFLGPQERWREFVQPVEPAVSRPKFNTKSNNPVARTYTSKPSEVAQMLRRLREEGKLGG